MIEVLKPGMYTTVQDLGRFSYRDQGVPLSGAMDQASHKFANELLGNDSNAATLEILVLGPTLRFEKPTWIAITGADCEAYLNDSAIEMNTPVQVQSGAELKVKTVRNGRYAYLAIAGGLKSESILGSQSQYQGITTNNTIQKGDRFAYPESVLTSKKPLSSQTSGRIEVFKGPEFSALSSEQQNLLLSAEFTVSNESNRMGYRLNTTVQFSASEIITSAVQPGTVQMTPSGKLIVLMRDCQTTGGYSRVLQLTEESINYLAQLQVGETFKVNLIH